MDKSGRRVQYHPFLLLLMLITIRSVSSAGSRLQPIHPKTRPEEDTIDSGPIEIEIEHDPNLDLFDIFDGSGDHRFPADMNAFSSHMTSEVYITISAAAANQLRHRTTTGTELAISPRVESAVEPHQFSGANEKCCIINRLSEEDKLQLKGQKGDIGTPGVCQQEIKAKLKGDKGDPGVTQYLVKIVGKDAPLVTKDMFAQFLKEALNSGFKGAKGDRGECTKDQKTSVDKPDIVVLKSAKLEPEFALRFNNKIYTLDGKIIRAEDEN